MRQEIVERSLIAENGRRRDRNGAEEIMMKIRTLPVYSKLAGEVPKEIADNLPADWHLSQHQVKTYEALTSGDYDVVFNTAMTGDGKSLAAFLRALLDGDHAIAMYPTNELIEDQTGKMQRYLQSWKSPARYETMFGAKITALMEETKTDSRVEQMRRLLERNQLLLTNPDLFHLAMNFKLGRNLWEQKELPFELPANFEYFIFDEFHIFAAPQVVDVVNVINYLDINYQRQPNNRKQFLFLSATPHPLMQELLSQSGLRVAVIEGQYQSKGGSGWRPILQACNLYFDEISREQSLEGWVQTHLAEIVQFFRDYPGSKGAIIVNSVAAAKRLLFWLKQHLPPDLEVGENTGLTNREERRRSFEKPLLVCTSTVDVGVDFQINLLIFEATSAGTFIQRFGRLGRHPGFGAYWAYALLPKFILERLEKALNGQAEIERRSFQKLLEEAYPDEQAFQNYVSKWGVLQTAHLVAQAQQALPKETPFMAELTHRYNQVFQRQPPKADFNQLVKRYYAMSHEEAGQAILAELTSFRGQSPLSCGWWDLTDQQFKKYDLFFLLANTQFAVIDKEEFMAQVEQQGLPRREFEHQLLYARVYRYVPEREDFVVGLKYDLGEHPEYLHQVQALKTFHIKESRQPDIDQVNKALRQKQLVCVLSDTPARELKRRLWLPMLFPVHRLVDLYGSEYSVTFGQEALLLESLLFYRPSTSNGPIIL
jgi:CRISPR-associated endonuclease/helicase Cas3